MKKTKLAILVVMALLAAGCGKIRTCYCHNNYYFDVIDTALFESFTVITIEDSSASYVRESAVECSYWGQQDTLEEYLPEYGVLMHYVFECQE